VLVVEEGAELDNADHRHDQRDSHVQVRHRAADHLPVHHQPEHQETDYQVGSHHSFLAVLICRFPGFASLGSLLARAIGGLSPGDSGSKAARAVDLRRDLAGGGVLRMAGREPVTVCGRLEAQRGR
jgi:hypothetical protein